ncbi:phage tail protein [Vibrio plantisponsor]|uniref:Phage tail protein n=1 Tax=Vibrio plantisponsor TaxID=664643 RepID=A0ABU4IGU2_9VIBR|nr:phage tail protein [Vibrio plantisponsor]MDW6016770.1 phage tail protein [Vibrio plantisponsor]NNM39859.1 phage tail protein [Vibrio plantisponsor]
MAGRSILTNNNRMLLDTNFIRKFEAFEDELPKVVQRAAALTNRWLRTVTMAELGYELHIDNKALRSRFRTYKNGRISKLWIGVNEIGVHRMGKPVQNKLGVRVGSEFYDGAFISPMQSDQPLVFRRTGKGRSSIEMVTVDISEDTENIINNYLPDINRKFEEFFYREFRNVLSRAA